MRRVLAGCVRAVVAANAVTKHIHMIEVCRYPANGRMAILAGIAARNMRLVFASRTEAVMATHTIADNTAMVKNRR